jgi:hypothetical protein
MVSYLNKNNHNTSDCKLNAKFKQQKMACFEAKHVTGKKSLDFLLIFENIMHSEGNQIPERLQEARSETTKAESLLLTENNLTISSDEGENAWCFLLLLDPLGLARLS